MSDRLPACTIYQPWASLIVAGCKPYEFRGRPSPKRYDGQRIALHAGARQIVPCEIVDLLRRLRSSDAWSTGLKPGPAIDLLERVLREPGILPLGSIVGTAVLGKPRPAYEIAAEFGGRVNDSDRDQHAMWAWPMLDVEPVMPVVPARGAQGFWWWQLTRAA
jgi:hypothetical protein